MITVTINVFTNLYFLQISNFNFQTWRGKISLETITIREFAHTVKFVAISKLNDRERVNALLTHWHSGVSLTCTALYDVPRDIVLFQDYNCNTSVRKCMSILRYRSIDRQFLKTGFISDVANILRVII